MVSQRRGLYIENGGIFISRRWQVSEYTASQNKYISACDGACHQVAIDIIGELEQKLAKAEERAKSMENTIVILTGRNV
jgi:hypothetical protein